MAPKAPGQGFRYEGRLIVLAGLALPVLLLAALAAGAAEGPGRVGFVASAVLLVGASGWLLRRMVRRIVEIAAAVREGAAPGGPTAAEVESLEAVLTGVRELRKLLEEQRHEMAEHTAQLAAVREELHQTRERMLGMATEVERQIMGILFRDRELT